MAQTTPSEVAGTKDQTPFAVLVVDGNEEHQILSVAALTRSGCLVRTAASGQQALHLAMGQRFDAVVIGSKLRDATGIEVLRLLADRFPTTPMIFVVPPDGEEAALQAMRSGATSYIVKTPRYTELLPGIVEEHIQEAANRRRLAETEQTQAQAVTERKTAEDQLSQSQTRLRMILQQAPVLLWSTDKELRVTSAMGGGFRTLDTSRSGERGLTLFEYFSIPDDDLEPIASHRRALAGEGVATQIDWQGRTYDVHIEPLRSPEGAILGTIGVAFDVSERMRTEETLRRSEERFRLLGRATNDVVWDWDLQTDGLWVNENVSKVFGFPPEEIEPTGAWWTEHLHPDDQERVVTSIDQLVRSGGSVWTSEYRFRRRDGTYATLVDRGYVLHDAAGHPVRVIGSAMDVSQRRKTEAIQSAVYRISEAANSAKDLPELYSQIHKVVAGLMPATNFYIALYDDQTDALEFPYFVDEEEGAPSRQPLGRGLTEYVLRTGRPLLASPEVFEGLVRNGEVVSVGPASVDWVGAPLVRQGKTIGVIVVQSYAEGVRFDEEDKGVLNFVSEQVAMAIDRKRAQERLLDAERLATMGQLAGFIAHELNTPLTSISLLTSAATKRVEDPVALEKLKKIDAERRRAAGIIRGLLSLSRNRQIQAIETDLRSVVRSAVEQMPRKRKKGVTLDVDVGEGAAPSMVDPLQIQEVLVNLLDNAMRSTAKGSVRVRIEERPRTYAILVADTGNGMAPEVVAHLFEPFSTSKMQGEGIGLGLLLAKHVVTGHGGTLEVTSEPGRGTTVTVLLPRKEAE
jgi:PAS domain S-box-containing protein